MDPFLADIVYGPLTCRYAIRMYIADSYIRHSLADSVGTGRGVSAKRAGFIQPEYCDIFFAIITIKIICYQLKPCPSSLMTRPIWQRHSKFKSSLYKISVSVYDNFATNCACCIGNSYQNFRRT